MAEIASFNHTPRKQQVKAHRKSRDGMLETVEVIGSTAGGVLGMAST